MDSYRIDYRTHGTASERNISTRASSPLQLPPKKETEKDDCKSRVGFYEFEKILGKGYFAVVKLARHVLTNSKVAVKLLDKKKLSEDNLKRVFREFRIMSKLKHPHIVKLYQVMETSDMFYIVMEYAKGGELYDKLVENRKFPEEEARRIFMQIIAAVYYCHSKNVVHRDLKIENLLLDSRNNIKLADFGFSNTFLYGQQLSTFCGSPPYAAPELFAGQRYDGMKADVWSMGIILYVLVCGCMPFDGSDLSKLKQMVLEGRYRIPFFMSAECEHLIRHMLCVRPEKRYTIEKILRHSWMNKVSLNSCAEYVEMCNQLASSIEYPIINTAIVEHMLMIYSLDRDTIINSVIQMNFDNISAVYQLLSDAVQETEMNIELEQLSEEIEQTCQNKLECDPSKLEMKNPSRRHTVGPKGNATLQTQQVCQPEISEENKYLRMVDILLNLTLTDKRATIHYSKEGHPSLKPPLVMNINTNAIGRRASDSGGYYKTGAELFHSTFGIDDSCKKPVLMADTYLNIQELSNYSGAPVIKPLVDTIHLNIQNHQFNSNFDSTVRDKVEGVDNNRIRNFSNYFGAPVINPLTDYLRSPTSSPPVLQSRKRSMIEPEAICIEMESNLNADYNSRRSMVAGIDCATDCPSPMEITPIPIKQRRSITLGIGYPSECIGNHQSKLNDSMETRDCYNIIDEKSSNFKTDGFLDNLVVANKYISNTETGYSKRNLDDVSKSYIRSGSISCNSNKQQRRSITLGIGHPTEHPNTQAKQRRSITLGIGCKEPPFVADPVSSNFSERTMWSPKYPPIENSVANMLRAPAKTRRSGLTTVLNEPPVLQSDKIPFAENNCLKVSLPPQHRISKVSNISPLPTVIENQKKTTPTKDTKDAEIFSWYEISQQTVQNECAKLQATLDNIGQDMQAFAPLVEDMQQLQLENDFAAESNPHRCDSPPLDLCVYDHLDQLP